MQRFKNILVYQDAMAEDTLALNRAARLARHNNAQLTVIDVMDNVPAFAESVVKTLHLGSKLEAMRQERQKALEQLVASLPDGGLPITAHLATGTAFLEIIRTVLRNGHDLVVKSVASEGVMKQTVLGSIDMHLLRKCPCPLWLIKPNEPERFRRILVALDPNIEDAVKTEVGVMILQLATSLAEMDGAEVFVLHAWKPYKEENLKARMEPGQFKEYVEAWSHEASRRACRFVSMFENQITAKCIHLVKGDPGLVIPEFARDRSIDLVVMGTLGRAGIKGLLIGDTAERILNRIEYSVLAVKTRGFVCPVTVKQ